MLVLTRGATWRLIIFLKTTLAWKNYFNSTAGLGLILNFFCLVVSPIKIFFSVFIYLIFFGVTFRC